MKRNHFILLVVFFTGIILSFGMGWYMSRWNLMQELVKRKVIEIKEAKFHWQSEHLLEDEKNEQRKPK